MCGCDKHLNEWAECTCICPEHKNFDRAYDLALVRYYEIVRLEEALNEIRGLCDKAEGFRAKWHGSHTDRECTCHYVDPDEILATLEAALGAQQ